MAQSPANLDHIRPLRVLSFGAGAIGAYIGGSLALHGCQVVFLEQNQVAAQLRQTGLQITLQGQEFSLPRPNIVDSLSQALAAGPFDVGLFALKSFDTQAAIEQLAPFKDQIPPILCLQNGVENEVALREALGEERVIAGSVTSAIGRTAPGCVVVERLRGVGISSNHALSGRLLAWFKASGLNPRLYANPLAMKWSKMLTNLMANASSAILNLPPGEVFSNPGLFHLEIRQMREALAVMHRLGIRPVDLPKTPVKALSFIYHSLPESVSRPLLQRAISGGRGAKMPSFHIDLHSRRGKSEVTFLNGAVSRFGQQVKVPTPVNDFLTRVLLDLTSEHLPLSTFDHQPQVFLEAFHTS